MSKCFKVVGLFSLLCLAVVMTACGGTARIEEKRNEAVIVTRPSRVVIENFNGAIEVVTATLGQGKYDLGVGNVKVQRSN